MPVAGLLLSRCLTCKAQKVCDKSCEEVGCQLNSPKLPLQKQPALKLFNEITELFCLATDRTNSCAH